MSDEPFMNKVNKFFSDGEGPYEDAVKYFTNASSRNKTREKDSNRISDDFIK